MMTRRRRSSPPPPPPPPPPASSPSVSYSYEGGGGEDSPPSAISPVQKSSVGPATTLPSTRQVPSSESSKGEEEVDDDGSESEEESNGEDSSEDSGHVAVEANPPSRLQDSHNAIGGKTSIATSPLDSSTEDGEEVDSSSDSDQAPSPQYRARAKAEGQNITSRVDGLREVADDEDDASEFSSSSDETANPGHNPSRNYTDASSKKSYFKPMVSHAHGANSSSVGKRSAVSLTSVSEKKRRTDDGVRSEGDQKKKDMFKRIWTDEDELALLQGILDYKELHQTIPSSLVQMEPLLNSVKGLLSISASANQMTEKIRRMKRKYMRFVKRVSTLKDPYILNAHDAAAFDLSRKIWGSRQRDNEKSKHLFEDRPSLHEFVKSEHQNMISILSVSHIPMLKAKEFDGKAKTLEITQFQVHLRKHKLLGAALKLIENALAEF